MIELTDPALIEVLELNYGFLTLENIWLPDLSADAIYIAGYPSERTRWYEKKVKGNLFVFRSQFRHDTPEAALRSEDAVTKGVDFFVAHRNGRNELTGEDVSREGLYGMSGCSVWGIEKLGGLGTVFGHRKRLCGSSVFSHRSPRTSTFARRAGEPFCASWAASTNKWVPK